MFVVTWILLIAVKVTYLRQYDLSRKSIEAAIVRSQQTQLISYLQSSVDAIILFQKPN